MCLALSATLAFAAGRAGCPPRNHDTMHSVLWATRSGPGTVEVRNLVGEHQAVARMAADKQFSLKLALAAGVRIKTGLVADRGSISALPSECLLGRTVSAQEIGQFGAMVGDRKLKRGLPLVVLSVDVRSLFH